MQFQIQMYNWKAQKCIFSYPFEIGNFWILQTFHLLIDSCFCLQLNIRLFNVYEIVYYLFCTPWVYFRRNFRTLLLFEKRILLQTSSNEYYISLLLYWGYAWSAESSLVHIKICFLKEDFKRYDERCNNSYANIW